MDILKGRATANLVNIASTVRTGSDAVRSQRTMVRINGAPMHRRRLERLVHERLALRHDHRWEGPRGFLAAACDDGGLPVFEVGRLLDESTDAEDTRRAIMAIEPADGVAAGDDRLKYIRSVDGGSGFLAVTANSGAHGFGGRGADDAHRRRRGR